MIKADSKVQFDENKPEKFTNFEELQIKFDVLQEVVDEHAEILRSNNLVRKVEVEAPYFDVDLVYKRLEEE